SSPSTRPLTIVLPPGEAGEVRDLGDLLLPRGLLATGQVVDEGSGRPVAGARLWTPETDEGGDLLAWSRGRLMEGVSGSEGHFELAGLTPGPITLRIEAPGYARRTVDFTIQGSEPNELGVIALDRGGELRVFADRDAEGGLARVDLGNRWLEIDMLTASISGGEAIFLHVPPGTSTLSLVKGTELLCEKTVEIFEGQALDAECKDGRSSLKGLVRSGGQRAGRGLLVWDSDLQEASPAVIQNFETPSGLRHQKVLGGGRPSVSVPVGPDGLFMTNRVAPGSWVVSWQPEGEASSAPLGVEIAGSEGESVVLDFPASAIHGVVVDAGRKPVARARVEDTISGIVTFTNDEGYFQLAGLEPVAYSLRARSGDRVSAVATVDLAQIASGENVTLILQDEPRVDLRVRLFDRSGRPAGHALVVAELEGQSRIGTADSEGRFSFPLDPPAPQRFRFAAWTSTSGWLLGQWQDLAPDQEEVRVAFEEVGGVVVKTQASEGSLAILSSSGWDLTALLRLIGQPMQLRLERPLTLEGLPSDQYEVRHKDRSLFVSVEPGELSEINF
ncbi:MAG: carboxypeptidase-like regulatory domain-containing protein, partial [Acidobacteriota bacterium]